MTEERRKEIRANRAEAFLLDQQKQSEGKLVDGADRITNYLASATPSPAVADKVAELVHAGGGRAARRASRKY